MSERPATASGTLVMCSKHMICTMIPMCGRFTLEPTTKFEERFKVSNRLEDRKVRYNIALSQDIAALIRNSPNRIMMMRWGLIPH